jgi:hypothetical protein
MTRPRAVTNQIDALAALLSDLQTRLQAVELQQHRHNSPQTALVPAGAIVETLWTTDPLGFLLLDGRTITGGEFIYPALWAVAPGGWKSGSDLVLPTEAGKMVRAF